MCVLYCSFHLPISCRKFASTERTSTVITYKNIIYWKRISILTNFPSVSFRTLLSHHIPKIRHRAYVFLSFRILCFLIFIIFNNDMINLNRYLLVFVFPYISYFQQRYDKSYNCTLSFTKNFERPLFHAKNMVPNLFL